MCGRMTHLSCQPHGGRIFQRGVVIMLFFIGSASFIFSFSGSWSDKQDQRTSSKAHRRVVWTALVNDCVNVLLFPKSLFQINSTLCCLLNNTRDTFRGFSCFCLKKTKRNTLILIQLNGSLILKRELFIAAYCGRHANNWPTTRRTSLRLKRSISNATHSTMIRPGFRTNRIQQESQKSERNNCLPVASSRWRFSSQSVAFISAAVSL